MSPIVRAAGPADTERCVEISRALPQYFTSDVPSLVREDINRHRCRVVVEPEVAGEQVLGFAVVELRVPVAEILWIAVAPAHRGNGLGTVLVQNILPELATEGVILVEAKTLDSSAGYEPYVATRAFWYSCGFVQVDTIGPVPGSARRKPMAILVAALAATT
jgi:GNAT superfamily N-acetyltransferase